MKNSALLYCNFLTTAIVFRNMRRNFLMLICMLLSVWAMAQKSSWATLSLVSTTTSFDAAYGIEVKKVKVSPAVKAMQGTELEVDGYIIPLTGKLAQNHFMLSKFSEKMCFFCGKAGPETAMQVFLAGGKKIPYTDEKIKVKGVLRINENDPSGLLYTLEAAQIIN
ncbi:MAG: hypothetical protein IPN73_02500 [Saprospiraceae bacterium]|nr:hypothetical protein [Saprospiraceae bacterium]MBK8849008.1 hypothetical protein [Saprospiraceae bacterium]